MNDTTVATTVDLFGGEPLLMGGLSNERDLIRQVPQAFRDPRNPWFDLANAIFFRGADTSSWRWKSDDAATRNRQRGCLSGALSGFDLSHEDKEALCGWMLSEMLVEVPA